jgi:hypothetical protein
MAKMCSLCGGIALLEAGNDFPICSRSGCICIGGEAETPDGYADTIRILQDKGYKIIGYNLPRLDQWEADYMISIVLSLHTIPTIKPPLYRIKILPEVYGVVFLRDYDPDDYRGQVKRGAIALKKWADGLPVLNFTKL